MCGSRGSFGGVPRQIREILKDVEAQSKESDYKANVESIIKDVLKLSNERDAESINRHLEVLEKALSKEIDDFVEMRFGGSIAKHSYVNGLSDIDVLVNIAHTELSTEPPQKLLSYFAKLIQERLPNTKVDIGKMSVIVKYSDKSEIQLLPAIKTTTGFKVSTADGTDWSNVVRPHIFAKKLTDVNGSCGGNVVPVIKLFKAAQSNFHKDYQLSGYHIESLAVNAFHSYSGNFNKKEMFQHLCNYVSKNVTNPIKDSTGQSIHVDDKLGAQNSIERRKISNQVNRLYKRLENADSMQNMEVWNGIFND